MYLEPNNCQSIWLLIRLTHHYLAQSISAFLSITVRLTLSSSLPISVLTHATYSSSSIILVNQLFMLLIALSYPTIHVNIGPCYVRLTVVFVRFDLTCNQMWFLIVLYSSLFVRLLRYISQAGMMTKYNGWFCKHILETRHHLYKCEYGCKWESTISDGITAG